MNLKTFYKKNCTLNSVYKSIVKTTIKKLINNSLFKLFFFKENPQPSLLKNNLKKRLYSITAEC